MPPVDPNDPFTNPNINPKTIAKIVIGGCLYLDCLKSWYDFTDAAKKKMTPPKDTTGIKHPIPTNLEPK
jgi:hypothetical protein